MFLSSCLTPDQENRREIEVKVSARVDKHLGRRQGCLHDAVGKNILDWKTQTWSQAQLCVTLEKLPNLSESLAPNMLNRTKDHCGLAHFTEQMRESIAQGWGKCK